MAANIGKAAWRGDDNSPSTNSRFISKPTNKKKITMSPSFIQSATLYRRWICSFSKPSSVFNKALKPSAKGLFAMINDRIRQKNNKIPPPVLESKNSLRGFRLINFAMGAKLLKIICFQYLCVHEFYKKVRSFFIAQNYSCRP